MKKISIIIPVYNADHYLKECIDSIILSKKNIEVLLIDDGSKDNSLTICNEYAKHDKRIKVYHKDNGGVSSARNLGLDKATGDYILFVDSDDVLSKNWDKTIDFVENDDIYYYNSVINDEIDKERLLRYITGTNLQHIYISGVYSKIYKKELITKKNIKFNEKLINGEDMIFNIEVALTAKSFKIIPRSYYYYRQTKGQTTRKFDTRIIDSDICFHKFLSRIFTKYHVNDGLASDIKTNCLNNAVILILNRISYIKCYKEAKNEFGFLNLVPYKNVINNKNDNFLIKQCKKKRYFLIYNYLRIKNEFSIILKYKKNSQFIEI